MPFTPRASDHVELQMDFCIAFVTDRVADYDVPGKEEAIVSGWDQRVQQENGQHQRPN